MSTIKVDTIQTRNGTGEIKVSNPVLQGHTVKVDGINDGDGVLGTGSQIQLHGATPVLDIFSYSANTSAHGGINFMKSASNTVGTDTKIANNDIVGSIQFGGYDSADYASIAGKIDFQMGGSTVNQNQTAGEMVFYTTPDGSGGSGSTERLRITHTGDTQVKTGNLVMSTSQKGIDFTNFATSDNTTGTHQGTPTVTGSVLMDYEQGTWPGLFRGRTGGGTNNTATGYYTKIGRSVHIMITFSGVQAGGWASEPQIRGLPFRAMDGQNFPIAIGHNRFDRLDHSGNVANNGAYNGNFLAHVTAGQSFIYISDNATNVRGWGDVNSGNFVFSGWYMTND